MKMERPGSTLRRLVVRRPILSELYRYIAMAKVVLKSSHVGRRHAYRGRGRMLKTLGPSLVFATKWSATDAELHGEMAEILNRIPRVHKLAHYLPIYASVVDRTTPIRMLAIGSFYEGSTQLWREYLHPDSLILSTDLNARLVKVADAEGTCVRIASGTPRSLLSEVIAEFGPFDVILDSGSQTTSQMIESFRYLFMNALTHCGIYMVENVNRDYWKYYRDSRVSFIDFVRALIDAMHSHYEIAGSETSFRVGHPNRIQEMSVPAITPVLGSIEIHDSIVVVRRAARHLSRSISRS